MELEEDWETEPFQNALKVVLKYEIQSLLVRLSETGEETMLLSVNTDDHEVGHLASPNAQRFLDSEEVGKIKNKFLFYLTGEDSSQGKITTVFNKQLNAGNTVSVVPAKPTGDRVINQKAEPGPQTSLAGKRRMDDTEVDAAQFVAQPLNSKRRKVEPIPGQAQSSASGNIPVVSQPSTAGRQQIAGQTKLPHVVSLSDGSNSLPGLSGKDSAALKLNTTKIVSKSGGYTEERISNEEFQKILKYNSGVYSDSEESIGEYDDDEEDEEGLEQGEILCMLPVIGQHHAQKVFQNQNFSNVALAGGISRQTNVVNKAAVSQGSANAVSQAGLKVSQPPSKTTENRKVCESQTVATKVGVQVKDSCKDDGGAVKSNNTLLSGSQPAKDNDVKKAGGDSRSPNPEVTVVSDVDKKQDLSKGPSGIAQDKSELTVKPADKVTIKPTDKVAIKPADKVAIKTADKVAIKPADKVALQEKDSRVDGNQINTQKKCALSSSQAAGPKPSISSAGPKPSIQSTGPKPSIQSAGPKPSIQGKDRFTDNTDELDTEELIRRTKEKHLEGMSEADRAIQAKLGQLSSKLSWVVEYPKEYSPGPGSQPAPTGNIGYTAGDVAAAEQYKVTRVDYDDEEEEEEEEEYDEEDYPEEGLDAEDLAALREAHMNKMGLAGEGGMEYGEIGPGYHVGGMVGMMGEGGYEEGEYAEEYGQYGEYNSEDEMNMHNMEGMEDVHNMEGMEDEEGGYGLEAYSEMDNEHAYTGGVQQQSQYQRMSSPTLDNFLLVGPSLGKCMMCMKIVRKTEMKQHNQIHLDEAAAMEEEEKEELELEEGIHNIEEGYDEEEEDVPEFTAEKFVAEKLVVENVPPDSVPKSNVQHVCDICNKEFKSATSVQRHMKIHTDSAKSVICPVCNRGFRIQAYLRKHLKTSHPDYKPDSQQQGNVPEPRDGERDISSDTFQCGICHLTFSEQDTLADHVRAHSNTK